MNAPRKHHYLPQFYLRGFSIDQKGINQIEKKGGKFYGCQIEDVAAIRDFHTVEADEPQDPYAVERQLAELEGKLASDLREFIDDGISNTRALGEMVGLLSLLRMRVPAIKQHIEASLEAHVRAMGNWMERRGMFPPPPPGFENTLNMDNVEITISNWKCLELMFGMAANPDILAILGRMRATLYRAPEGMEFMTCDQPVAIFHPTIGPDDSHGAGPAHREIQLSLPLTKKLLLKLDHHDGPHSERVATSEELDEFNRRTIVMAVNYIFAAEVNESLITMIQRHSGENAGFKFDHIEEPSGFYQLHRCVPVQPMPHSSAT